ncbi:UNVERIFIED_CONTAM: hypothetical protein GTU68_040925 [Idotea baltica]|nr:hypothetical protein [Idotea baltica]
MFISDLHLEKKRSDITRAFLRFLQEKAIHAKALYILGDFFEVWLGDDVMSDFHLEIAHALTTLAQTGTRIYIMHGNRDFLLGEKFCQLASCTLIPDPTIIRIKDQSVLLMHGDSLCTQDIGYIRLRRYLRNPASLWLLKKIPKFLRKKLAQKIRNTSQTQTQQKTLDITDVTEQAVQNIMQEHHTLLLIHGHTHRPANHSLMIKQQQALRMVLGDWDKKGWAIQCKNGQFTSLTFSFNT